MHRSRILWLRWLGPLACACLLACSRAPSEPDPAPAAAPAGPAVAPLAWDVPGAWTVLSAPRSGPKKATYRIPKVGNDKEDGELSVFFYGTGSKGDPGPVTAEWLRHFDGDAATKAERAELDVGGKRVATVEASGTYKVGLAPPIGPNKQPPVSMVKQGWRLYGAVVKTADRGNWFFLLTGPDETVQANRAALRAMLEAAR